MLFLFRSKMREQLWIVPSCRTTPTRRPTSKTPTPNPVKSRLKLAKKAPVSTTTMTSTRRRGRCTSSLRMRGLRVDRPQAGLGAAGPCQVGRRCGGGRGEGIWVIEGALPGQETMRAIDRSLMQEKGNILFRYIQQILDTQRHISAGSKGQSLDRSKFTRLSG